MPGSQTGAALAVTLMLLSILLLAGVSSLRAATVALRLSSALQDADRAFTIASRAIDSSFDEFSANPATLPPSGSRQLPTIREAHGRATLTVLYSSTRACPPPLSGERHDYELRVTATAGRGASSHQRQYFYLCREACGSEPCAETGPVRAGWVVTRPDWPD